MTRTFRSWTNVLCFILVLGLRFTESATLAQVTLAPLAQEISKNNEQLQKYFAQQTQQIADCCLATINSREDWDAHAALYRQQLAEMLGLDPFPPRTELQPVVTGQSHDSGVMVERLHFQSLPGLYVTANFYRPENATTPLPAILYLCGHAKVKHDDVSYGNKTAYHHHGVWFARHGYVCLMIDTIQLGEIEGVHHGTHNLNQWWWNNRGYTPAGVEAWNGIRALDYLEQRPEVDAKRIGVTGRSGGGAYSWWVAALDQRIAAAVPVAGITSLHNHVVDGCVDGHCDCMYPVNTYRWDFAQVAALVAPRPLLIANSDNDTIFPLEGVVDVHHKTRRIYQLLGAEANLGLNITPGPHTDTQELQVPAFRWFDRHLKNIDRPIEVAAVPVFEPQRLRVFEQLPSDERVTTVAEFFVPSIPDTPLPSAWFPPTESGEQAESLDWQVMSAASKVVQQQLSSKVFAGWPNADHVPELNPTVIKSLHFEGIEFKHIEFTSQSAVTLPLFVWDWGIDQARDTTTASFEVFDGKHSAILEVWSNLAAGQSFDQLTSEQRQLLKQQRDDAKQHRFQICVVPRGIGPATWSDDPGKLTQIRRRFMLLGQTVAGMQVWDIKRAMDAFQQLHPQAVVSLQGQDAMAAAVLLAALGEDRVAEVVLVNPPANHRQAADYLNIARIVEPRQLAGLLQSQGTDVSVMVAADQSAVWNEVTAATSRMTNHKTSKIGGLKVGTR
ncbi:MAG: acetylxylan esterase [Pirellulaceae bacterium]|nr:acetylxylan esterase [Pirellulaceae bacterium]